jgi:hypothetical protein
LSGVVPGAIDVVSRGQDLLDFRLFGFGCFGNLQDISQGRGVALQQNLAYAGPAFPDTQNVQLATEGRFQSFPGVVGFQDLLGSRQGDGIPWTPCRWVRHSLPIHHSPSVPLKEIGRIADTCVPVHAYRKVSTRRESGSSIGPEKISPGVHMPLLDSTPTWKKGPEAWIPSEIGGQV